MRVVYDQDGITLIHGDCLEVLPTLEADWLVTDPPYGFRKAGWDDCFDLSWLTDGAKAAQHGMAIMPGVNNIGVMPFAVEQHYYRWCLAMHLVNGMTRGIMGFGNWIPALIYTREGVNIYALQQDCADIVISGEMPDHPSPKPYRAMHWLLSRLPDGSILDPFTGSGTTLVAAKMLGRKAIGIEIDEGYCNIAIKRLEGTTPPLPFIHEPKPEQGALTLDAGVGAKAERMLR